MRVRTYSIPFSRHGLCLWRISRFFQKSHFFKNHTFSKITLFQKSHFFKNHTFWANPGFSKITLFQKSHLLGKSRFFKNHTFKNHTFWTNPGFLHTFTEFRAIFKTSVFLKNSPFKVHFGIPRLTTCKKAVFPYKISVFDYEI